MAGANEMSEERGVSRGGGGNGGGTAAAARDDALAEEEEELYVGRGREEKAARRWG